MKKKLFLFILLLSHPLLSQNTEAARKLLPEGSILDVSYENLCKSPATEFSKVLEFCGLDDGGFISRALNNFSLVDTGAKWRQHLSEEQQGILNSVLSGHLKKYGYTENGE